MKLAGIRKDLIPTEEAEQRALAQWLDLHKILWCHVPNGGQRSKAVAGKLKAAGVKAGVCDVLVFDPPWRCKACRLTGASPCGHLIDEVGVAIELKRAKPASSRISDEQAQWMDRLSAVGWFVQVCYGASEAIALLESLGFGGART